MVMTSTTENNDPASSKVDASMEKDTEKVQQIGQLLGDGYKLYLAGQYEEASDKLGEATHLSVDLYGQFAPQCFLPHYQYGRSLVEIARSEAVIVKTKSVEEQEDSSDEEEEEEEEGAIQEEENEGDNAQGDEEEEEQDGDLKTEKLAWESLEVARQICEKQEESALWSERKADVLIALGDCLVSDDQLEEALKEFSSALAIQQSLYPPHDRRLAETYFHIGRTHRSMNMPDDFERAAVAFEHAGKVLQLAIDQLEEKAKTSGDEPPIQEEIDSLKSIIEEVKESVVDARGSAETRQKQLEERKDRLKALFSKVSEQQEEVTSGSGNEAGSGTAEVDDLTSQIVRKGAKRAATPKEGEDNDSADNKKPKMDEE